MQSEKISIYHHGVILRLQNGLKQRIWQKKKENPKYKTTWWFLKVYDYKEAWQKSYNNATREEQNKIKDIIHFDADIFYEISWIRIDEEPILSCSSKPIEDEGIKIVIDDKEYVAFRKYGFIL